MFVADLPPDLDVVRKVLIADGRVLLAIAFGSLAHGTHGPESDVDLAIDVGVPLATDVRIDLIRKLASATGRPIDLIDLRSTGVPLSRTILTEGIFLVCDDLESYANHVIRMHRDVEDFLPLRNRLLRERLAAWTHS